MISVMGRRYCVKFSQNNSDPVNWWERVGIVSSFFWNMCFFIFLAQFFSAFFCMFLCFIF